MASCGSEEEQSSCCPRGYIASGPSSLALRGYIHSHSQRPASTRSRRRHSKGQRHRASQRGRRPAGLPCNCEQRGCCSITVTIAIPAAAVAAAAAGPASPHCSLAPQQLPPRAAGPLSLLRGLLRAQEHTASYVRDTRAGQTKGCVGPSGERAGYPGLK